MQKSRLILIPLALSLVFSSLAAAQKPLRVDLSKEKDGAEPTRFLSVVGDWSIATDDG